jgi:hypothetical protein
LGVVVVAAGPGLNAEFALGREIPHEITHLLLARATGEAYHFVPSWLSEGLAVLNQALPDPRYPASLNTARDAGQLWSLNSLCHPFQGDMTLAYAQSESVTRFIRAQFGSEGIHGLVTAYAAGAGCGEGIEQALNLTLPQLENRWLREVMYPDQVAPRFSLLAPWLLLTAVVLAGPALFLLATWPGRLRPAAPPAPPDNG